MTAEPEETTRAIASAGGEPHRSATHAAAAAAPIAPIGSSPVSPEDRAHAASTAANEAARAALGQHLTRGRGSGWLDRLPRLWSALVRQGRQGAGIMRPEQASHARMHA